MRALDAVITLSTRRRIRVCAWSRIGLLRLCVTRYTNHFLKALSPRCSSPTQLSQIPNNVREASVRSLRTRRRARALQKLRASETKFWKSLRSAAATCAPRFVVGCSSSRVRDGDGVCARVESQQIRIHRLRVLRRVRSGGTFLLILFSVSFFTSPPGNIISPSAPNSNQTVRQTKLN